LFYEELKKDPNHRFSFFIPVCYFFNFIVSGRAPFYFTQVLSKIFRNFSGNHAEDWSKS